MLHIQSSLILEQIILYYLINLNQEKKQKHWTDCTDPTESWTNDSFELIIFSEWWYTNNKQWTFESSSV